MGFDIATFVLAAAVGSTGGAWAHPHKPLRVPVVLTLGIAFFANTTEEALLVYLIFHLLGTVFYGAGKQALERHKAGSEELHRRLWSPP